MTPLESLVATGTKLWLDSIDPQLVQENRAFGATGATSNPIIISDLLKTGRFDEDLEGLMKNGFDDEEVAWAMTDILVSKAESVFNPVYTETKHNNGYVSFELDPLLEDEGNQLTSDVRSEEYIRLGKKWAANHENRMIKIPATPAGLGAVEELVAAGLTLNITLIFSSRQYREARDAVVRGAKRRGGPKSLKSVYSIFVSRIDVYTEKHCPNLIPEAQGQVGILNAKRIWAENQKFWKTQDFPLEQEIIFASTGTKKPEDPADKYVSALAGSDIQTNPPGTNAAVQKMTGKTFTRMVDVMPPAHVVADIDAKVDFDHMERTLMEEGLKKFADPQNSLLALIKEKRASLGLTDSRDPQD